MLKLEEYRELYDLVCINDNNGEGPRGGGNSKSREVRKHALIKIADVMALPKISFDWWVGTFGYMMGPVTLTADGQFTVEFVPDPTYPILEEWYDEDWCADEDVQKTILTHAHFKGITNLSKTLDVMVNLDIPGLSSWSLTIRNGLVVRE